MGRRTTGSRDPAGYALPTRLPGGSTAHFELSAGEVSRTQRHRTVGELWYVVAGSGAMWRRGPAGAETVVGLGPGPSLSIPVGTHSPFRSAGPAPLAGLWEPQLDTRPPG